MNTKIYFNQKFIRFTDREENTPAGTASKTIKAPSESELQRAVLSFVQSATPYHLTVVGGQHDAHLKALKKSFYYIEAAGGLICRGNEYLCIHRFGRWDLPKGKLEKGELPREAAVRECEEECGVQGLRIEGVLRPTLHIYSYKDGYALKQTFWYLMRTSYTGVLTPQTEENIDAVRWFSLTELKTTVLPDTYLTIGDVISEAISAR